MFIPRASPSGQLCLLLLSPGVFLPVTSLFLSFIISTSGSGFFLGCVLPLTKKLRTLSSAGTGQANCSQPLLASLPELSQSLHLALPPRLLRALFNLRTGLPLSFFRASLWVDVSFWALACGFWGLLLLLGDLAAAPTPSCCFWNHCGGHPLLLGCLP